MLTKGFSEQTRRTFVDFVDTLPASRQQMVFKAFQDVLMSTVASDAIDTGEKVPVFVLPNVQGSELHLASLLQRGPVVLSFYRGSWCPFCDLELRMLQKHLPEIRTLGATLLAVSPENPNSSLRHVRELGLEFDVLTDRSNAVAEKFGLLVEVPETLHPLYLEWGFDLPASNCNTPYRLPVPATYVIDSSGIVRAACVDNDYTRRMQADDILEALHRLYSAGDPGAPYLQ